MAWQEIIVGSRTVARIHLCNDVAPENTFLYLPGDNPGGSSGRTAQAFAELAASIQKNLLIVEYPRVVESGWDVVPLSDAVETSREALKAVGGGMEFSPSAAIGSSFGCAVFLSLPEIWPKLEAVVLKSPAAQLVYGYLNEHGSEALKNWAQRSQTSRLRRTLWAATSQSLSEVNSLTAPVLLLHGTADQIIPHEQSIVLSILLPNAFLHSLDGCGHSFAAPSHRADMVHQSENFLREHLFPQRRQFDE